MVDFAGGAMVAGAADAIVFVHERLGYDFPLSKWPDA